MTAIRQQDEVVELPVRLNALDGFELEGTCFALARAQIIKQAVVLNAGGGIASRYYRRFARFLAAGGIPVLTYDYRGIGASRPSKMRGFPATIYDWSEFDCGGAIAWLRSRFHQAELVGIGHSIGPLMFGGARNAKEVNRFIFVCAHTGYYGDYRTGVRLPMALLWHVLMPWTTRAYGFFPGRRFGLGEDLPEGVAMQWATRTTPDFRPEKTIGDPKRGRAMIDRFGSLTGSVLAITIADDAFATPRGTQRLLSYFPGLVPTNITIVPRELNLGKVGHFRFFGRVGMTLWPMVLAFIRDGIRAPPG